MPDQPKTPLRSFRVPDEIWRAALARAQAEGTTVTAVLVQALDEYGSGYRRPVEPAVEG